MSFLVLVNVNADGNANTDSKNNALSKSHWPNPFGEVLVEPFEKTVNT